jgi:hypothetical protein
MGTATGGFLTAVLAASVSAGLIVVTLTVLLVDMLRGEPNPDSLTLRLYLLFGGTVAGILIAAFAAWRLLQPVSSAYRRGGLSVVASFATVVFMLVCIPIHQWLGRTGLFIVLGVSCLAAVILARKALRLRGAT